MPHTNNTVTAQALRCAQCIAHRKIHSDPARGQTMPVLQWQKQILHRGPRQPAARLPLQGRGVPSRHPGVQGRTWTSAASSDTRRPELQWIHSLKRTWKPIFPFRGAVVFIGPFLGFHVSFRECIYMGTSTFRVLQEHSIHFSDIWCRKR